MVSTRSKRGRGQTRKSVMIWHSPIPFLPLLSTSCSIPKADSGQGIALYKHFKSAMHRGLETEMEYKPDPSCPTEISISRVFSILDDSVKPGTLKDTLNAIDTRITLGIAATSGAHGYVAKGYPQHEKYRFPLDWKQVRGLRDRAIEAVEAWVSACDQTRAEAEGQTRDYGPIQQ